MKLKLQKGDQSLEGIIVGHMGGLSTIVLKDCYGVQPKAKHHHMPCYDGR